MPAEPQPNALVGTVLEGAYRITRLIGEGGMGAVYEAVQLRLNKRVAVKLMARDLATNREALARFHREAEITSQLGHPHLVTVIDFGQAESGEPYLVMEYLDGEDLDHRLRRVGQLPLETVVHVVKQVASALGAAHDQGVVHRDLKPANVFLLQIPGEPDFAKVLDFGISKMKAARTQLTNASTLMGTPNYMSPEQATGLVEEIDHRVDQWALACIAWQMLLGRGPFVADEVAALLYQIINLDPHPLAPRVPGLPEAAETALRRALSKRPANRFPSLREFSRAFEAAAAEPCASAAPVPVAPLPASPSGATIVFGVTPGAGLSAPLPLARTPYELRKSEASVPPSDHGAPTPQETREAETALPPTDDSPQAPQESRKENRRPEAEIPKAEDDSAIVAPRNRIKPVHLVVAAGGVLLLLGAYFLIGGRRSQTRPLPTPAAAPAPVPPPALPPPPAPPPASPPPPTVASPEPAPPPSAGESEPKPAVAKRTQPTPAAERADGTKSPSAEPFDVDKFLREHDPKKAAAGEAATDRRANPYRDPFEDKPADRRANPYRDPDTAKPAAPGPAADRRANPWRDPFVDGPDAVAPAKKTKKPNSPPATAPAPGKPGLFEEL